MAKEEKKSSGKIANASAPQKQDPLYQALLKIGRVNRSIKASVLSAYPALLGCEAVTRQAGRNATDHTRAERARQVLMDAINDLNTSDGDQTDFLIAQAALCATSEFEGQQISARKELLAEKYHIPGHVFRDRRPYVLSRIVAYLGPNTPSTSSLPPKPVAHQRQQLDFSLLHELVTTLHFDAISSLLITAFRSFGSVASAQSEHAWTACAERLFLAHARLHSLPNIQIGSERFREQILTLDYKSTNVPGLYHLFTGINTLGPEYSSHREPMYSYGRGLIGYAQVIDIFGDVWLPWYTDNLAESVGNPPGIEVLAAKTGAVSQMLEDAGVVSPHKNEAQSIGESLLDHCLDIMLLSEYRDVKPRWFFHGSQATHIKAGYIENMSKALSNSLLVWHDGEINVL
ncbi:MAG: hypothetical protein WCB49_12850 [Gammaproteobacteria bacterium]